MPSASLTLKRRPVPNVLAELSHKFSWFVVTPVSDLGVHGTDGRLRCRVYFFDVKFMLRVCSCLGGVGGSDRWFGTSVEDTVELPRSQGSLPVKPEALKNSQCRFLSPTNVHSRGVFFIPRKCSPAHISTHSTVSHHRSRSTQIPRNEGIVRSLFFVHFCVQCICASAALR